MNRNRLFLLIIFAMVLGIFIGRSFSESAPDRQANPIHAATCVIPIPDLPEEAKQLEMVLIPAGDFLMGTKEDERELFSESSRSSWSTSNKVIEEKPQRRRVIENRFYIGKYEITQAQWNAVMNDNPSMGERNSNFPVENITWNQCQKFIDAINRLDLGKFRLPTEAEWEYACRAGTTTRYYWGDDPDQKTMGDYCWYDSNSDLSGPKEIGFKLPNAWGLYDMAGNVEEWCMDGFTPGSEKSQNDPSAPYRILRGGGWRFQGWFCRSSYRSYGLPDLRHSALGLRIVMNP